MNAAITTPAWLTPEIRAHLKRVEYEYQVREFGEEMARINAQPAPQRRREIAQMTDHAGRKGVKFEKPALGVTR